MLRIENVSAQYSTIKGPVAAVRNTSFDILDNEIFGVAGESGCGKSTMLKVMYDLVQFPLELSSGRVVLESKSEDGKENLRLESGSISKAWWKYISYIPQAAMSVLNPVYKVDEQFYEIIKRHYGGGQSRAQMRARLSEYLTGLELPVDILDSYPHQLSGGMRQRVVIAMATFLKPNIILADEPTTALDVVVQRNILMMLMELQQRMGNTFVIVSHDMGVHYQITKRLGIMYAGTMVELGPTQELFEDPLHPYTQMLIGALPKVGDHRPKEGIPGAPPSLRQKIEGCSFAPRCPRCMDICKKVEPPFVQVRSGRCCACHLVPPHTNSTC